MEQQVILVNETDEVKGAAGKMEAHKKGLLHRAFSVFVFNQRGEMLLQQRALNKYHSGGLWTNACCSHPEPNEETEDAAMRRLKEEMGFETDLEKVFDFVYKAEFENGLIEYEFDHVFTGEYDGDIKYSKEEVMDCCYKAMDQISDSLQSHPQRYTAWFRLAFPKVENWWNQRYKNRVA
ncbi:MAG: isopentenyl-diphosphate Delta-isomerase [Chitinophagaceae bacterium]